jgi:hypothetical protein
MTISQLLRKISKLKGEVQEQRARAQAATVYKEKEPPAFSFEDSMCGADRAVEDLVTFEAALRRANSLTTVSLAGGKTITLSEATCRLQELKGRIAWLKTLPSQAQNKRFVDSVEYDTLAEKPHKVTTTYVCPFPEAMRSSAIRSAQEAFDSLNDLVETANHQTVVEL